LKTNFNKRKKNQKNEDQSEINKAKKLWLNNIEKNNTSTKVPRNVFKKSKDQNKK
jgi:hypothetical protein